jgi:peptidoglycan/xylan/chitin deacetylase (PgdA/CDA1 family)
LRASRWFIDAPAKHIKIDDEEQASDEQDLYFAIKRRQPPLRRILRMVIITLLITLSLIFLLLHTIYKPPFFIVKFLQWRNPDVIFHVPLPKSQRVVALSLDDAPSSETGKILDLLKAYSAKATFFVIGSQISDYPTILKRMRAEGHEIGNHAWADEPSISLPLPELERQIKDVEALILSHSLPPDQDGARKNTIGDAPISRYFRPGSGLFNAKMVEKVRSLGYRVVLGSIYPHDPQIHNPKLNARHVLSRVRPGGIIIMHDRRSYSAEQLELVLKGLAAGGWAVESVGGLSQTAEKVGKEG